LTKWGTITISKITLLRGVSHACHITSCEERLQFINLDDKVMVKLKNSEANKLYSLVWKGAHFYSLVLSRLFLVFHNKKFLIFYEWPLGVHRRSESLCYFYDEIIWIYILPLYLPHGMFRSETFYALYKFNTKLGRLQLKCPSLKPVI
jgi:hypothetical protein